jgi:nucleotide-binding universal stress UspA family protein
MRILVATDGSRESGAAVKFAARLAARDEGCELVVLTIGKARERGAAPSIEAPVANLGSAFEKALERRAAQKILDGAAKELQRRGLQARYRFVRADGRTAVPEAISREADRFKADMVVVGSEGRDTMNEWVVGGVALRLIYVARRPVTVVRPPRRRKAS